MASICKARNLQMPSGLIVMGDNTVRELKNQYSLKYLANLCAARKMRICCLFFLRKSHTHDQLDQVFGVLARRISRTDQILSDSDTVSTITHELSRPGIRAWLGARCELHVEKLNCVRNLACNFEMVCFKSEFTTDKLF